MWTSPWGRLGRGHCDGRAAPREGAVVQQLPGRGRRLGCVSEFHAPTCVVVKHTDPCGVASGTSGTPRASWRRTRNAVRADPVSAFGGIVAFNVPVTEVSTAPLLLWPVCLCLPEGSLQTNQGPSKGVGPSPSAPVPQHRVKPPPSLCAVLCVPLQELAPCPCVPCAPALRGTSNLECAVLCVPFQELARDLREFRSPTDNETRMFYEIVVARGTPPRGWRSSRASPRPCAFWRRSSTAAGGAPCGRWAAAGLLQESDDFSADDLDFKVVTKKQPTAAELEDVRFAWRCVKHVKSNAITIAKVPPCTLLHH